MVELQEKTPLLGTVIVATRSSPSGPLEYLSSSGGGGSGGAVTVADGADVTQGAKADAPYIDADGSDAGSVISLLKAIWIKLLGTINIAFTNAIPAGNNNIGDVDVASIAAGDNNIGNVDIASAIPAGANVIGKVSIDQATPGTTNAVSVLGTGIHVAASVDVNTNISADVDAAVAAAAGLRLMGFAVKERSGTAGAVFDIVHGATADGGTIVAPITLNANESVREWFGPDGIATANGISINFVSGSFDVYIYYKTVA